MDKLMKVFGSLLPKLALKMIRNKKDDILTKMNEKMNLPLLDEADERELLEGIWSAIEEAIDEAGK